MDFSALLPVLDNDAQHRTAFDLQVDAFVGLGFGPEGAFENGFVLQMRQVF